MSNPILVIEDEPDVRESIKEILEIEGFRVATAGNGEEALTLLQSGTRTCLILLDLMMPVMDGWQFLKILKEKHQDVFSTIPIIVVSAAADLTTVEQQYSCRVMNKPCNIESLLALAHEHCKH